MACLVLSVVSVIFAADAVFPVSCPVILSSLVDGIAQILIFVRLPFASTVRTWQTPTPVEVPPFPDLLLAAPAPVLVLVWIWLQSCKSQFPIPDHFESSRLHIPHSLVVPSSQPPSAVPNASKFKHFRDRSGQKTPDSLSNNLPLSQAFSRPTTTEVSPFPGSVDQPALVFLQSCRLTRCG